MNETGEPIIPVTPSWMQGGGGGQPPVQPQQDEQIIPVTPSWMAQSTPQPSPQQEQIIPVTPSWQSNPVQPPMPEITQSSNTMNPMAQQSLDMANQIRQNPTGMSPMGAAMAGVGYGIQDLWRGSKQIADQILGTSLSQGSAEDYGAMQMLKADPRVGNYAAAGEIVGNIADPIGLAAVPAMKAKTLVGLAKSGALAGGIGGGLMYTPEDGSRLANMAGGAVMGGVALPAIQVGARKAGNLFKSLAKLAPEQPMPIDVPAARVPAQQADNLQLTYDVLGGTPPDIIVRQPSGANVAGNLNLDRIDAPVEVKNMMGNLSNTIPLKTQAHEQTVKLAEKYGATVDDVASKVNSVLEAGGINKMGDELPSISHALRQAYTSETANTLSKFTNADFADPAVYSDAVKAFDHLVNTSETVSKTSAGIGRALEAHKIPVSPQAELVTQLSERISRNATPEQKVKAMQGLSKIDQNNPLAVHKYLVNLGNNNYADWAFEAWRNGLLSTPATQVVNGVGNMGTVLAKFPEEALAATYDLARSAISGKPRERFFGEAVASAKGLYHGFSEGLRRGIEAFINEIPPDKLGKLDTAMQAIPSTSGGWGGHQIRLPYRFLGATDEFFKTINYNMELYGLAYRNAKKEGLTGTLFNNRVANLISNPTKEMMKASADEALVRTFTAPLGEFGATAMKAREKIPGARYLFPFVTTPINIAKEGLTRTPFGFLPLIYKGAKMGSGEFADNLAKPMMGTMLGAAVYMLAQQGKITGGGPADPVARERLINQGWQPYSYEHNGKYYDFKRVEYLGTVMGMAADAYEAANMGDNAKAGEWLAKLGYSMEQNLTSKTYMATLKTVLDATADPDTHGARLVSQLAGSAVPGFFGALARAQDPVIRKPMKNIDTMDNAMTTVKEAMMSRIPGQSQKLQPSIDLYGEPKVRETSLFQALASPSKVSTIKPNIVDAEMVRLGFAPNVPGKRIRGVELSPADYTQYAMEAGKNIMPMLQQIISSEGYRSIPNDVLKQKVLEDVIAKLRQPAQAKAFAKLISTPEGMAQYKAVIGAE